MKKLSFLMAMLAAVLLMASCSKQQKSAALVPDDASVVLRFDAMQAFNQTGLDNDKSKLRNMLDEMLSNMSIGRELKEKITSIVEDPTRSGIDLTEPAYLYVKLSRRGEPEVGFVADVASASNLTSLLNAAAKEAGMDDVENGKGGIKYLEMGREATVIYNDEWVFIGRANDAEDMAETLLDRADGQGSLQGNKAFETMCDKKGVMQMLLLYAGLEKLPEFKDMSRMMPEGLDMADLAIVTDLALAPGEMTITGENVYSSKEWKDYASKYIEMAKPIDKDLAKYVSGDGLSLFINMDMDKFLPMLEQMAKATGLGDEELEEAMPVVKNVCEQLTGTAAIDFYGMSDDGDTPLLKGFLGTKGTNLLDMALQNLGGDADDELAEKVSDNEYFISQNSYSWNDLTGDFERTKKPLGMLGFRDGQTYFSTDKENVFKAASPYPTDKLKGIGAYVRFNFKLLDKLAPMMGSEYGAVCQMVAEAYDDVEFYCKNETTGVIRLTTTDKKKNPLAVLFDLFGQFVE